MVSSCHAITRALSKTSGFEERVRLLLVDMPTLRQLYADRQKKYTEKKEAKRCPIIKSPKYHAIPRLSVVIFPSKGRVRSLQRAKLIPKCPCSQPGLLGECPCIINEIRCRDLVLFVSNLFLQVFLDVVSAFHLTDVLHSHHSPWYLMAALFSFVRLERAFRLALRASPCIGLFLEDTAASLERDSICPPVLAALYVCGLLVSYSEFSQWDNLGQFTALGGKTDVIAQGVLECSRFRRLRRKDTRASASAAGEVGRLTSWYVDADNRLMWTSYIS